MARAVLAALWIAHGLVTAADPALDGVRVIQERRAFMSELGATLRAAWEKLDSGDTSAVDREARLIAEQATRIIELFPAGRIGPGSRARPEVTEQPSELCRLTRGLRDGPAARDGAACRACHQHFVEPPR